jgi:N-glycosylase/DNA lyase
VDISYSDTGQGEAWAVQFNTYLSTHNDCLEISRMCSYYLINSHKSSNVINLNL